MRYNLGRRHFVEITGQGGIRVLIGEEARKCVVFLGFETTNEDGSLQFTAGGTGFFIERDGYPHLVTVSHVAKQLDGTPFALRSNLKTGNGRIVQIDRAKWVYHPDQKVDVAAFVCGLPDEFDVIVLWENAPLAPAEVEKLSIGTGTEVYVAGLFRLLQGSQRNLPIIHTGHIAMMPDDERIPVKDKTTGKTTFVEGYLSEVQALEGASGSPVFARENFRIPQPDSRNAYLPGEAYLLGMWQSSWDAPPGEILAQERSATKVPVGMGVVIPAHRILEVLDMEELVQERKALHNARAASNAPTMDR